MRRFSPPLPPQTVAAGNQTSYLFVLGGAVLTHALPSWTHLAASVAAVFLHGWAFMAEWRAFAENNRLMDDPKRYARAEVDSGPNVIARRPTA